MLFWRAKSAKQAIDSKSSEDPGTASEAASAAAADASASGTEAAEQADVAEAQEPAPVASGFPKLFDVSDTLTKPAAEAVPEEDAASKVIPISSATRLSERLAEVSKEAPASPKETTQPVARVAKAKSTSAYLSPASGGAFASVQAAAITDLEKALSETEPRAHVLIYGEPGTGRSESAEDVARALAASRQSGNDFIYFGSASDGAGQLRLFEVPAHTGEAIVRDVRDALQKASAMLSRHVAGDGHQMSLAMLEEDHRQRSNGGIEELKRRAEAQNIALVNTSEGFVLAPMHDGRVVRADVFRALPAALQREVEAKITAFESELHALLQALPGTDIATDDRHMALCTQTAERALKPSLAVARKLTAAATGSEALIDAIESQWLIGATDFVRQGDAKASMALPPLSVVAASAKQGEGAPVIVARSVTAADLVGEVGRDGSGAVVVRPGALSQAGGGFLIVDAWRLVNDPEGYAVLSRAIETATVEPLASSGLAVKAEAQPLTATVILITERRSLRRLKALDPRLEAHFGEIVHFGDTVTAFDLNEEAFGGWVAALAERGNFRRVESACAAMLYEDARSRAGDMARVSLDAAAVVALLTAAERRASAAGRTFISVDDVKDAVQNRAVLRAIEVTP